MRMKGQGREERERERDKEKEKEKGDRGGMNGGWRKTGKRCEHSRRD